MKYAVDVEWTCYGVLHVEADNEEEARSIAWSMPLPIATGEYVNESFTITNVDEVKP